MISNKKIKGGVVGIIIDTRGRPLALPEEKTARVNALQKWAKSVGLYAE